MAAHSALREPWRRRTVRPPRSNRRSSGPQNSPTPCTSFSCKGQAMSAYRPFSIVEQAPPDPILGIVEQFKKDANPKKVNLCIGVFQDETGKNPVLKSVKQAEKMWLEQENTKDYLNMAGEE